MDNSLKRKRIGKITVLLLVCVMLLAALSGCLSSCGMLGGEYLTQYMDEIFKSMFNGDAISVNILLSDPSALGIDGGKATLPEPETDKAAYESSMSSLKEIGAYLLNFNYSSLSPSQKCDYDTLMNYFYQRSKYADYYYFQDSYLGSTGGWNVNLPIYLDKFALRSKADVDNWISLVEQPYTVFPKYLAFEQSRINAGYGRADFIYEGIEEQAKETLSVADGSVHFLITLFDEKLAGCSFLTETEKAAYKELCASVVSTKFIPAYQNLATEIVKFVGNANNNNQGLSHYEGGAGYYELLFSNAASTGDNVNTAYLNLTSAYNSAISRAQTIYDELAALGISRDDVGTRMQTFTENSHLTKSELETYYSTLTTAYSADFPALPTTVPKVTFKEVPEVMSKFYNPASYFLSALDNPSAEETVYINSANAGDNLGFSLISHEGIPGHQLQHAYYKTSGAHMLRSAIGFTGYAEGWATYAQYYASKYYQGSDVDKLLFKLYLLNDELTLYIITMMDIDVNYYGLSKAQLLEEYASMGFSEEGIENTFEYVCENPATYTSYGYGYYKMDKLKHSYAASDLAFHTAVLRVGPTTYELLEKYI